MNNQNNSTYYETSLFCLDKVNKNLLPKVGGIYVLWEDGRIYCGSTDNLLGECQKVFESKALGRQYFIIQKSS